MTMTSLRLVARALIPAVLLLGSLPASAGSTQDPPIRPGAFMNSPAGCTLNFVFSGGGRTFIGTAGHCTSRVGDRVSTPDSGPFGTVVVRRMQGRDDFALIRIDTDKEHLVGTALELFGSPTGVISATESGPGDPIGLEGNGIGFGWTPATRSRVGALAWDDEYRFVAELPAIFGDSGGPVVHLTTGKALGIVSGITLTIPPSTLVGTTVQRALALAAADGYPVTLVTN